MDFMIFNGIKLYITSGDWMFSASDPVPLESRNCFFRMKYILTIKVHFDILSTIQKLLIEKDAKGDRLSGEKKLVGLLIAFSDDNFIDCM